MRQEILTAARELFVKEGFGNVSMRRIAKKIEYSPTTIYLYFEDKYDLLDCIVEERLQELCNQFQLLDAEAPARPDRLAQCGPAQIRGLLAGASAGFSGLLT